MSIIRGHGIPNSLSTVLFDLDDTLLDSFDARVKALEQTFTRSDTIHPSARQFLRNLRGSQLKDALARFETTRKTGGSLFEEYRRAYWAKESGLISLYQGIKPMLEKLLSHGVKLGIVTRKGREFELEGHCVGALKELQELGVANLFSVIIGFEDVNNTKPHPEGIIQALNHLEAQPQETLFVGDSTADIEAAHSSGCWSCYAIWGIPVSEYRLDSINADFVAGTPRELLDLIIR